MHCAGVSRRQDTIKRADTFGDRRGQPRIGSRFCNSCDRPARSVVDDHFDTFAFLGLQLADPGRRVNFDNRTPGYSVLGDPGRQADWLLLAA